MSDLPEWIDERIDRNLDNTLTQEHVVETMCKAERPFFSIRQLRARVKPDIGKATVRNRLNELQEIDVIGTETYPDSITLYYIDHEESDWPLSPEGKRALASDNPLDRLSTRGFLLMTDTAGIRTLILAGFQLSLVLFTLGGILTAAGINVSAGSDFVLWGSAFELLGVCVLVLVTERASRWIRSRYGPLHVLPSS